MYTHVYTYKHARTHTQAPSVYNDRSFSYCIALQSLEWSLDEKSARVTEGERPDISVYVRRSFGFDFGGRSKCGGDVPLIKLCKKTTLYIFCCIVCAAGFPFAQENLMF